MLSDIDKKEMEEHFSKHYLLIPKSWMYHVAGGILSVFILGLGISYQAVLKVLDSQMANEARQNIMTVEKSAADWLHSTAVQESNIAKQRIALVDGNGKEKVVLATTTTGSGLFQLYDDTHKERLRIAGNSSSYAGLWFKDSEGSPRMILTTDSVGLPSLYLYDSTKKKRLQLYEDKGGYAGLALLDRTNKSRMKLMTEPETGLPALEMYNDKGAIMSPLPAAR